MVRVLPCLVLLASCTPFMPVMEQCTSEGCDAGSSGGGTAGGGSAGGGDAQDPDGGPSFCELNVSELQFGVVSVGDSRALAVIIDNPTSSPVTVSIGAPTHPGYELLSGAGTTTLQPGQSVTANVRFAPIAAMEVLASVSIQRASICSPRSLSLRGEGIASAVEWTPASIDFGAVPPDITSTRFIVFRNGGSRPATLTEVSASGPPFSMMTPTTSLVVPAHGELTVGVQVRPVVLGARTGTFTFTTPDRVRNEVVLRVVGGGPVLKVAPVLDFGRVAFFPGATQSRFLPVSNDGTTGPAPSGLLRLGTVVNGRPAQPPLFELVPVSNLTANEVTVSLAGFPNTMGLTAKESAYVEVSLTPTSPGVKRAELRLFSNDQRTPVTVVQLEANVVSVPGCSGLTVPELTAGVSSLDFGQVEPGRVVRRGVTLVNAGTQACEVADLDVSPPYRIEGGRVAAFQLQPGEKRQVIVELRLLPNTTAVPGVLRAFVASANAPTVAVPLTATPGTDCLVFLPGEVDFASNAPGCGATRSVALLNRCEGTYVELTGVRTVGVGFSVQGPMRGSVNLVTEQVSWRPASLGREVGALAVTSVQGLRTVTSWALLQGTGATGRVTDTIVVPPEKADVLIVMDDSCSMAPKQAAMAANLNSLLQSPFASDAQFGVTTTGRHTTTFGHLVGPSLYVTSVQANRLQQLQQAVTPGTGGSAISDQFAAALAALSPPLSLGVNRGFMRDDARLGVIIVSEADDQSNTPIGPFMMQLSALKPRQELLTLSVMVPLQAIAPAGCTYRRSGLAIRATQAANQLGGIVEEICSSDWAAALTALGTRAMAPSSSFSLRAPVDQTSGSVTVSVQGQQVMPGPSTWSLSASTNSVVFTRAALPQTGETVTVTYPVACLP